MENKDTAWKPLKPEKLAEINRLFRDIFPGDHHGSLADDISVYWERMLRAVWRDKPPDIKRRDEGYCPRNPLTRIRQKTVVIAYADSVSAPEEATLNTLDAFLGHYFPAIGGLHMLPACQVVSERFNDGYFSQVVRHRTHPDFGTNKKFAEMVAKYYSMADFVLNHVDIANPAFQAYLDGENARGDCFYIFTEKEYRQRLNAGDFDRIFRPRPFPLFSIFRRKPADRIFAVMGHPERVARMKALTGDRLPEPVITVLAMFTKLKNDQTLLDGDYRELLAFRAYLTEHGTIDPDTIFTVSETQETQAVPYILGDTIRTPQDLLEAIGYDPETAQELAGIFARHNVEIFGEEIRALTTFSHVQVDLNTATFPGLKMLADDFAWYLGLDLDMLRLDAANFAFKRWKTTCFGLPEVKQLLRILTLSLDCVAPRIVANLEVNDRLSAVLAQMADRKAPPPMMYDFHLASMLPVAFMTQNAGLFDRIFQMIAAYDIPSDSIRFSLVESHDGKSVRGSLDLLTLAERQALADTVEKNGGRIKYKEVARREYSAAEFESVCREAGIDFETAVKRIFGSSTSGNTSLVLAADIQDAAGLGAALGIDPDRFATEGPLKFFYNKILKGREPYELCVATRDCLPKIRNPYLEAERYLAFYTLAFALMGRNVKSVYFNDLLGLPNDGARFRRTGELRDIKRTKSGLDSLAAQLADPDTLTCTIGRGMNNLVALVDADPALRPCGNEAGMVPAAGTCTAVALVHCSAETHTLVIVNLSPDRQVVTIEPGKAGLPIAAALFDNIRGETVAPPMAAGTLKISLQPFQRCWLTAERIPVPPGWLVTA